ncbi:MAG: coenzyme PQQ biosynthesis protein PqqD [Comamonadaceae bacterium]|nr:MAG: coenzyme PQQ biosynthesis protein PqqD [Comamonadaceae bacterium]
MLENTITADSIICHSHGQVATSIDDQIVLLSLDKGNYYGMNGVLTSIWHWVAQPMRVSDICKKLIETYEVSDEVCKKDVQRILLELQQEGLIEIKPI